MIFDFLLLIFGILALAVVYHIVYTRHKEREWRQNNPDEFRWPRE
jgi:cbb3-type cytochrome oxidase subunit 3